MLCDVGGSAHVLVLSYLLSKAALPKIERNCEIQAHNLEL